MNAYLLNLQKKGNINSFEWTSEQDVESPYDFLVNKDDADILIDVKTTPRIFDCDLHISLSQLRLMSSEQRRYDIYRVFDLNEESRTAQLRIAKDVRNFAKKILKVFENYLPQGVAVDAISVSPSILSFQDETEIIDLPDELEVGYQALAD